MIWVIKQHHILKTTKFNLEQTRYWKDKMRGKKTIMQKDLKQNKQ